MWACDVFDDQHLNVDRSGKGALAPFLSSLSNAGIMENDVIISKGSSSDLSPERLSTPALPPFRIFSVDGGHTLQLTHNDITLAAVNLASGGIIVLDDIPNLDWWGVMDGVFSILHRMPFTLAPFFIGSNKMMLTTPHYHQLYYESTLKFLETEVGIKIHRGPVIAGWEIVFSAIDWSEKARNLWKEEILKK